MFPPVSQSPTEDKSAQGLAGSPEQLDTATTNHNVKEPAPKAVDPKIKKRNDEFRQRVDQCKQYRRKLIANWTVNIDYRRGKPFASQTDQDQIAVNLDWSLTKSKQAALFSQVPQVRLEHSPETLPKSAPWASKFESKLNEIILESGIEAAMDEVLPDCINAAGIGAVLVSFDSITEDRQVPVMDVSQLHPDDQAEIQKSGTIQGQPVPMTAVPHILDHKYSIERISPADLLWPINFTSSNFDKAPWLGRSGRVTWADAVQKFKLTEEDKDTVMGEDRPMLDKLTHDVEKDRTSADEMVGFDELFFKEYQYDSEAKSYSTIHHLVFVNGKNDPVIDEPWKGQQVGQDGSIVGVTITPIRVLTLTYITDETIPPSDSAIGRPQVDEINKARTQMIRQRERSLPVRWFDVNRIDPTIQQSLMRGTWQAMIPVQGEGTRVIGEVTKATMPPETFKFNDMAKADLLEEFGAESETRKDDMAQGDPNQNKSSFNTRTGRERARVASFFVSIAQVLGGLMCLYEDPQSFGQGFNPAECNILKFSILADSTVLLDAGQKLSRLNQFINLYAKSGWVNLEPVLQEVATLTGLDPSLVIKAPQPKPPVEPNISLRLTGVEDMLNPLALAFLIKSGQAPPAPMIEQAKALIQQAVVPPQGMQMPGQVQPQGGLPMLPAGQAPPGPGLPPPAGAPPPGTPLPQPAPPRPGEANPQMAALEAINHKTAEGGKQ
jgi:hypothetical protein